MMQHIYIYFLKSLQKVVVFVLQRKSYSENHRVLFSKISKTKQSQKREIT